MGLRGLEAPSPDFHGLSGVFRYYYYYYDNSYFFSGRRSKDDVCALTH